MRHSTQKINDGTNCGVICSMFAQMLLGKRRSLTFDTDARAMWKERQIIWRQMVREAVNCKDLCFACGEEDCPLNQGGKIDTWVSDTKDNGSLSLRDTMLNLPSFSDTVPLTKR